MNRKIVGFHQDEEQHWVAELECGHNQHVRHTPPWTIRPWVITPEGRTRALGRTLAYEMHENPQEIVVVNADSGVDYGLVVNAMDRARKIGVRRFALATEAEK